MLDFRAKRRVPDYLHRSGQWRLLLLVMTLGMALLVGGELGNPDRWRWFDALTANSARSDGLDTRLAATDSGEPGVLRIAPPVAEQPAAAQRRLFPGVEPAWLATIADDKPFRASEHEAFYSLLELLGRTDQRTLDRAASGRVTFLQLFGQPDAYRGELVTLQGTVRQALHRTAGPNQHEIDGFYKLVLQPRDAPGDLVFIYALNLPDDFPLGEQVRVDVELTGLFFKRWAYQAQQDIRTAPLLLAKSVHPVLPTTAAPAAAPPRFSLPLAAGIALLVSAAIVLFVRRRERRPAQARPESLDTESISRLADATATCAASDPGGSAAADPSPARSPVA